MNKKEFKNKIEHWKKGDYVLVYSFNYDRATKTNGEIIKYIENQDKEIGRLKEDNEYLNKVNIELSVEKNRLNNIINELEKWVKEDKECFETQFYMGRCVNFQCILDKLQELKGDKSNDN